MVRLRDLPVKLLLLGLAFLAGSASFVAAQDRTVDPTFLRRYLPDIKATATEETSDSCLYKPLFGTGDAPTPIVRGVVRFGEMTIAPDGKCTSVSHPLEEQIYVVMEGSGTLHYDQTILSVKKHDFVYLPAGVRHMLANSGSAPLRFIEMGFRLQETPPAPLKPMVSNFDDIPKQVLSSHPDSVTYQLLMGDTNSKRDRLAAAHVLTSLFIMEFAPGGTNFPHHHDAEEEIYLLLDGSGEMVAGSGMDGLQARFPAKPGDAYFFRLNCTVGFYNGKQGPAHILAVRSLYPRDKAQN